MNNQVERKRNVAYENREVGTTIKRINEERVPAWAPFYEDESVWTEIYGKMMEIM